MTVSPTAISTTTPRPEVMLSPPPPPFEMVQLVTARPSVKRIEPQGCVHICVWPRQFANINAC